MALKTETRDVTGFTEVAIRGMGDATLIQGDAEGLVIEADEALLPRIKSEVRGGRLVLGLDMAWWEWLTWWFTWLTLPHQVRYTVRLRNFAGASIAGSGKVISAQLQGGACRFSISGSGRIAVDRLAAESVETRISGSGYIAIAGRAQQQALRISGSGRIDNEDLETETTEIHISGSGRAAVNATKTLDVNISGSGSVFYRGRPQVQQHISGSGRVGAAG